MDKLRIRSAVEQVAEYLKAGLAAGLWCGEMPGVQVLAAELGVNHKTVDGALALLVHERLLAEQGARRPRRILVAAETQSPSSLRIAFLLRERIDRREDYLVEARHRLIEGGHHSFFVRQSMVELGMDVGRVAACVARTPADAWVVQSAPRELSEWFAGQAQPCFALFGFFRRLRVAGAGPDKAPAYAEVAKCLIELGHRRIVLLARPQRRHPLPGRPERYFLRTLGEAGIEVSDYHFPYWQDTPEDFHRCLESLFRGAPPTALLVQEPLLFAAVQAFLAARGLRVPRDVSLVCDDPDPIFAWQDPTVAHIGWQAAACVRRLVRWAENTAHGVDDRRQALVKSQFVPGGTVGPVRETG